MLLPLAEGGAAGACSAITEHTTQGLGSVHTYVPSFDLVLPVFFHALFLVQSD